MNMTTHDAGRRKVLGGLAVAGLATVLPPLAWAQQGKPLKIGYVSPQTGPLAAFGETDTFTLGQVRKALAGGIRVGDKTIPVEIIVKDSQSNPNRAAEVASDLINRDGVQLMLCAATPDTTNPVADQCELAEIPCLSTASPWEAWYFGRGGTPGQGFDWTYHFFFGLGDGIAAYTALWEQLPTNKTVGLLFPNDADGEAWADKTHGLPPALKRLGYKQVDTGRLRPGTDNFSAQIAAFKRENVEIVSGVLNPPDFTTFWNQARQQGFKPKIVTIAKALVFPAAVNNLGASADGLTAEVVWSPYHPFNSSLTGASSQQIADAWQAQANKQWSPPLGWLHALFEVAVDAIKRSGNPFDAASLRDALKATQLQTVVGQVDFANGPVPNASSISLPVGQWKQGGPFGVEMDIVSNATAPAVPASAALRPLS